MQSKQYFTKIKNYPHEKSTEPQKHMQGLETGGDNGSVVILGGLTFVNFPLCIHLC